MKTAYLSLPTILLLTACGGGGGGEDVIIIDPPVDNSVEDDQTAQNAGDGDGGADLTVIQAFTVNDARVIEVQRRDADDNLLANSSQVPTAQAASFTGTVNSDGSITIEKNGLSVTLEDQGDGIFSGSSNAGTADEFAVFLQERNKDAEDVTVSFAALSDFDARTEGFVAYGNLTSADTANALAGTEAVFIGTMNARITGQDGQIPLAAGETDELNERDIVQGFGGGRLVFNFDSGLVSGEFNLNDPTNGFQAVAEDHEFPRLQVLLEETTITDGTFNGEVNVVFRGDEGGFGNTDIAWIDGGYQASLFGDEGQSAGGTVNGTIDNNGNELVFQGGFATERE